MSWKVNFGVEFLKVNLEDFGCKFIRDFKGKILSVYKLNVQFGWWVNIEDIWVFEFPNGIDEWLFIFEDLSITTLIAIDTIG